MLILFSSQPLCPLTQYAFTSLLLRLRRRLLPATTVLRQQGAACLSCSRILESTSSQVPAARFEALYSYSFAPCFSATVLSQRICIRPPFRRSLRSIPSRHCICTFSCTRVKSGFTPTPPLSSSFGPDQSILLGGGWQPSGMQSRFVFTAREFMRLFHHFSPPVTPS
jgi:hypothetical protein